MSQPSSQIEINDQFAKALDLLEHSRKHIFLTGKAGTGKSTLLSHFRKHTKKNVAVLAPTGVAAINVAGQTIHSFFKFRPDITPDTVRHIKPTSDQLKLYKGLDTIIVDEVSMVRADLLDCIDRFLQIHGPERGRLFGGVQMIFIGDLHQLPPVVTAADRELFQTLYPTPYFFSSKAINECSLHLVELQKIYRQNDNLFIDLLNNIRLCTPTQDHFTLLNSRYSTSDQPFGSRDWEITLTSTNALADDVNERHLSQLPGIPYLLEGKATGTFQERDFPTKQLLTVKKDAQVMMLNNDSAARWVNGSIGKITNVTEGDEGPILHISLENGKRVEVNSYTWEAYNYFYNDENNQVETKTVGTFSQFPLRLAWAVTIHKSQGKTFDRVVIDIGRGAFSHGQVYVALSRCRSLEGITLKQPITQRHLFTDRRLQDFFKSFKDGVREFGQSTMFEDEFFFLTNHMPHLAGGKITGSHTTVIDAALPIVKALLKMDSVSKIVLGMVTSARGGRGKRSVKVHVEPAGLRVKVRGNTAVQELWVYTQDKEAADLVITGAI